MSQSLPITMRGQGKASAKGAGYKRVWETHLDPADLDRDRFRKVVNEFLGEHGANALAISFIGDFPGELQNDPRCKTWQQTFDYEEDFNCWAEAYRSLDRLLERLPDDLKTIAEHDYHKAAGIARQLIVLKAAEERIAGDLLLVAPWQLAVANAEGANFKVPGSALEARAFDLWTRAAERVKRASAKNVARFRRVVAGLRNHAELQLSRSKYALAIGREAARRSLIVALTLINRIVRFGIFPYVRYKDKRRLQEEVDALRRQLKLSHSRNGVTIVTIDDSGTGVNLKPGLEILRALERRGEAAFVLTNNPPVAQAVRASTNAGAAVLGDYRLLAPPASTQIDYRRLSRLNGKLDEVGAAVTKLVLSDAPRIVKENAILHGVLDRLDAQNGVKSVLTIYESLPLSVSAGQWAGQNGKPWIGFFPILVGNRPDGYHFPAPEHLVYGDQLRDHIAEAGHPIESATVVGSPTYDVFHGRDKAADRAAVYNNFPACRDKKLVVVATEAFPDPLTEMEPILNALGGMEGVHVIVKVHPSDRLSYFQSYVSGLPQSENIEVVQDTDLGALLQTADLLICVISNIIISAAVMGTPNLVCDFGSRTGVIDFVKEGLCIGCNDRAKLKDMIHGLLFDPEQRDCVKSHLARGLARFNGPSDGRSAERIADYIIARANSVPHPGEKAEPAPGRAAKAA